MTLWTASEAAAATGGQAQGDWFVGGISIDSRTIEPGDLFVALTDQRDGHDFVAAALDKGAGAAMVSHVPDGIAEEAPLLVVNDVLAGLEALGRAARARFQGKLIAVTGSVGKTSTKEMLRAVLTRQGRVHAAEKSFNNHWGVPVTLARMPADADFAVIEIGMNHPGEIAPLAALAQPHVALITTIAPAHIEAFEDIEGIAVEKASLFTGLVPGGVAVFPGDLPTSPILAKGGGGARLITFGADAGSDFRLTEVRLSGEQTIVRAAMPEGEVLFRLATAGRHFAMNGLGALAAADALGADVALVARDMDKWVPPAGRGARHRVQLDPVAPEQSFELIDDAFNANPTSLAAALEVLAVAAPVDGVGRIRTGRRIAIIGDMLELGEDAEAAHANVAANPYLASVDVVHCVGPLTRVLHESLPERQAGIWCQNAAELVAQVHQLVDAGDVVLVKGSKGIKVSLVVAALKKLDQRAAQGNVLAEQEG